MCLYFMSILRDFSLMIINLDLIKFNIAICDINYKKEIHIVLVGKKYLKYISLL